MDLMVANSATPPAPEQGQGRWTEGVCGDGAAILFDGAMVPIKEVVRALNGRPATLPAPELLEANFRAWHKEARGSLYYGAMPLCDAIEWAQHLLQQVTLQALVPPAVPAPPITEPSALPELVRYGFIGCGPNRPLLIRLVDGYWTPWHIAATLLQRQQAELASLRVAPVVVSERPWEREGWCDAEGRCWFCNAYSMGRWSYDTPPDPEQDWGRLGALTHSLPHWAIQRPRAIPQPAPHVGEVEVSEEPGACSCVESTPPAPEPQTPPTDDAWWPELVNEIARVQQVAAREGQGGRMDLAKAVELWCRPATPQAPEPGEVEELHPLWYLVEFLEGHSLSLRQKDPTDELAQVLSDSATLFKRLASPAYPIVDRLPEGCLDLLKSEPGRITACSAGVSIEPLRLEPVAEIDDRQREAVHQAVAEALGTAYDCQRVWEAWNVGTMGPDDFVLVAEDSNRVAEIADAAIDAIWAILAPAPVPVGECPNCGYEGEIAPAPQAGDVEA